MNDLSIIKMNVDSIFNIDIANKTRKREYAYARCIYFQLASIHTKYTQEIIASFINKERSIIPYSYKMMNVIRKYEKEIYDIYLALNWNLSISIKN